MRRLLFTLMLLVPLAAFATIYKWVDENGVVHYSDQPHENAQKVQIGKAQTYNAQHYNPPPDGPPRDPSQQTPVTTQCVIASPEDQTTLENTDAVSVAVQVDPAPTDNTTVVVMLDGRAVASQPSGQLTLTGVERGEHNLTAVVRNGSRVLCTTASVTFFVQKPSIQNPQSPVRPH